MKILFTNNYSIQNKGDAAITSVMLRQFRSIYPRASITISTMEDRTHQTEFEGIPLVTSFFYEGIYAWKSVFLRVASTCSVLIESILWALLKRMSGYDISCIVSKNLHKLLHAMDEANLVVGVGGGYLVGELSIQRYITLILHLHTIIIAKILNKPVIMYSQSVGPFPQRLQEYIVAHALKKVDLIIAREGITEEYLAKMGILSSKVYRSVDAGFLLEGLPKKDTTELLNTYGINVNKKIVMVTVKNIAKQYRAAYEQAVSETADWLLSQPDTQVVFVPQVTSGLHNDDDREVMKRLALRMKKAQQCIFINEELSHYQIKSLYKHASFLLATRMHSAIFAMSEYIPTVAIAYEHKTTGIMHDLGLDSWVIPVENVTTEELIGKINNLNENRQSYLKILNQNLPDYLDKARKTIFTVKKVAHEAILSHSQQVAPASYSSTI